MSGNTNPVKQPHVPEELNRQWYSGEDI